MKMSIFESYALGEYNRIKDKRVVLLQSGGLDSCVLASIFSKFGYEIHHLFVDYGFNSASRDFINVQRIVEKYGGTLHKAVVDFPWLKSATCLVDGEVNDKDAEGTMNTYDAGTYVPMRNAFLITMASSLCESLKIPYIASALDGSEDYITHAPTGGTSDKHPTFVRKLESALNEGSSEHHINKMDIRILTPVMNLTKVQILQIGEIFGTDFSLSNSCYNGGYEACGECSACILRKKAFEELGIEDPIKYKK